MVKRVFLSLIMAMLAFSLLVDLPTVYAQDETGTTLRKRRIRIIKRAKPTEEQGKAQGEKIVAEEIKDAKSLDDGSAGTQKEFYLMGPISEYATFENINLAQAKYGISCCVKLEGQKFQFCVVSGAMGSANGMTCQLLQGRFRGGQEAILHFKNIDGSNEELVKAMIEILKGEGKQARIITKVE